MSGNDVSVWEPAPADVALAPNQVHVWRAWLDVAPDALRRRAAALTQAERERAATFRLARDGARFAAAHGALRAILARYCGVSPAGIRLAAGPYGKPLLADGGGLAFNLSHADDLMLCAVAQDRAVGIDVERVRDDLADREIAARVLSPREAAVLAAVPDRRRTEVFFDLWTRKEAYAKGLGIGLTVLERLEVVPDPVGWTLVPLTVAPGFAATVAIEGEVCRVSCWELPADP